MKPDEYSHIGRYGTISLMKRNEPNAVITAFGIDTNQLTFGRDPSCGVRLYYDDVSVVHCKIVFEEYKAFLVVLGASGLLVDDCNVYPNSSPGSSHTMIPLTNNSEFEIHGKRFRFTYPPKDLRPTLYASPAPLRTPRLSMIRSTKVFAPRPSPDPRENLRVLKSPLKNTFKSPLKKELTTPLRANLFGAPKRVFDSPDKSEQAGQSIQHSGEEEEGDIVLVEGNQPRVVEEDQDLIILEDVEVPSQNPVAVEAPTPKPPQTPVRRRSLPRNTLHRAVLIRSAQRAVMKAERDEHEKKQEEEEELEVLDTVASGFESDSEDDEQDDEQDDKHPSGEDGIDEEDVENEEDVDEEQPHRLTWRKSLENLWPFRSSSPERGTGETKNATDGDGVDSDEEDEVTPETDGRARGQDDAEYHHSQTPVRRTLGQFMTPQVRPRSKVSSTGVFRRPADGQSATQDGSKGPIRYSLGGEARRVVRSDQVWRVRDIVIPESRSATRLNSGQPEGPFGESTIPKSVSDSVLSLGSSSPRTTVSEEERQAIRERRRSALRDVESFFPSGVPGMGSPAKLRGWSPAKTPAPQQTEDPSSPRKMGEPSKSEESKKTEDAMDTRVLLERMKGKVEDMKRRRSLATPSTPRSQGGSFGLGAPPTSPSKTALVAMMDVTEEVEESEQLENHHEQEAEESSSLLPPGTREEAPPEEKYEVRHSSATELETVDHKIPVEQESDPAVPAGEDSVEDVKHKRRARSKTPSRKTKTNSHTANVDQPPMPSGRRGRKAVEQSEISEAVTEVVSQVPTRRSRQTTPTASRATPDSLPRRGRRIDVIGADNASKDEITPIAEEGQGSVAAEDRAKGNMTREAVNSKRSSRKAVKAAEGPAEPPPRRGRTPKAVTAASEDASPAEDTQRAVKTTTAEANSLDTIATEDVTTTKSKGRKKLVQQETSETRLDTAAATTVATKTRTKVTASKTTDAKTRIRKTPATAPPAIQQDVNKENTPGSEVSSNPDVEEPVKIRVSRTAKKAASGTVATKSSRAKRDESDDEIAGEKEAPSGRVMRATRARTRT